MFWLFFLAVCFIFLKNWLCSDAESQWLVVTAVSPASPPLGLGPGQRKPEKPKRARQSLSLLADSTFGLARAAALREDQRGKHQSRQLSAQPCGARAGQRTCGTPAEGWMRDQPAGPPGPRPGASQGVRARPPRLCAKADRPAARAFLLGAQPRDAMVLMSFGEVMGAPKRKTPGPVPALSRRRRPPAADGTRGARSPEPREPTEPTPPQRCPPRSQPRRPPGI